MVNSNGTSQGRNNTVNNAGCFKCNKKCDFCTNILKESNSFSSIKTGKYSIKQTISCTYNNSIYLATCKKCHIQDMYVGSTATKFKVHFRNHKSSMLTSKKTCEVAVLFNSTTDIKFIGIERIIHRDTNHSLESILLTREAFWSAQLCTLFPHGLNKRQGIQFQAQN